MWPSRFVGGQSLRRALQVKPGVERTCGGEIAGQNESAHIPRAALRGRQPCECGDGSPNRASLKPGAKGRYRGVRISGRTGAEGEAKAQGRLRPNHRGVQQWVGTDEASWCAPPSRGSRWSLASQFNPVLYGPSGREGLKQCCEER